jgi:hypothetical protein
MTETSFAARIRERYPEGLTGVFAIGGTRTTYILANNQQAHDPGRIETLDAYADYGFDLMYDLITSFFELGGQNIVFTPFSYQLFSTERGTEYAQTMARLCSKLLEGEWIDFCHNMGIDQYFAGIDTLLHVPNQAFTYELALQCQRFNQEWQYEEGRHKIIWEMASIPLFSIWRAHEVMGPTAERDLEVALEQSHDMQEMHDLLYKYYARAVYGTDLPVPHFYLGTNRNGDLKLRALLPIALLAGGPFRLYYTPYPSLSMTLETFQTILEDLAFGKPLRSTKTDYSGQITSEVLEAEYQRVQELSADPYSTLGLVRRVQTEGKD